MGPYQTSRMIRAASSVVDGAMHYGPVTRLAKGHWDYVDRNGETRTLKVIDKSGKVDYVLNPKFVSWGLRDILKPVQSELREWKQYAIGRAAEELYKQGRERLFDPQEIRAQLALGEGKPHFAEAFDQYQEWNKKIVDFAQDMGIINPDERARWQREAYIPFYRVGQRIGAKRIGGIGGNIKPVYKLKGGTGNLNDIVDNMIMNAQALMTEAIKNQARQDIVSFALKHEGGGRYIVPIAKDTVYQSIDKGQVIDTVLQSMYGMTRSQYNRQKNFMDIKAQRSIDAVIDRLDDHMPEWVKFMQFEQTPRDNKNVVAVLYDGKPRFFEVTTPLYRSMEAFTRAPIRNALLRGLNNVRRLKQAGVTLTLDFMLANIVRDTINASVFSKHGFIPFYDSARGLTERLREGPYYSLMIANGGGMSSYLLDPKDFENHLRNVYNKHGVSMKGVLNTPRRLLVGLEMLADAVEMSTRIGEFRRDLRSGEQPRVGAYNSREISTDWSMRGDDPMANIAYDIVPFLKAGVISLERAYRGSTKDYNRSRVWLNAASLAAASAYLYTLNRGNPDYEQLEDWEKNSYWHIFIGGQHLKLPKIWEAGALATVAERMTAATIDQMEKHPDWAKQSGAAAQAVGNLFYLSWKPAAFAPLYDIYATGNEGFTGRPIIPPGKENLAPFAQYGPNTSPSLVHLAEQTAGLPPDLQFSPARAQALVYGYLSGWGALGLQISDHYLYGKEMAETRPDQMIGLRRFVRSSPLPYTQAQTDFYNYFKEADSIAKTYADMIKENKPAIAQKYGEKDEIGLQKQMKVIADRASEMRSRQLEILRDPDLSPAEKRKQFDAIQADKNKMFNDAMESLGPILEGQ